VKDPDRKLFRLALVNDLAVGALACRLETVRASEDVADTAVIKRMYIMTLGCLFPYRRKGIGRKMLSYLIDHVKAEYASVSSIYLNVQTDNEDAIEFYKANGFTQTATLPNYYKRLTPSDAYVLSLDMATVPAPEDTKTTPAPTTTA
jgi:ribosomal protein S18 acetylase RimI-like enzyme